MSYNFKKSLFSISASLAALILATLSCTNTSMFDTQPRYTIKTEKDKEFDESSLIGSFNTEGNIADCLKHCLENCRCQSFQICNNTKCQLCSSHKKENNSLLRHKEGCVYATYEIQPLSGTSKNFDGQCSEMSCLMNDKCCQQSAICPQEKICKPNNSTKQAWKRFTCECPEGYYGNNCDQPIRSCQGYAQGSRISGKYKVVDSSGSFYVVYCHFDSDGAWTLVQSSSFANHTASNSNFKKALTEDFPVSQETAPEWTGYRLSKARMKSINENSDHLQYTCNFDNVYDVSQTDYLQMSLDVLGQNKDITTNNPDEHINSYRGKINEKDLSGCNIKLHQDGKGLHVHVDNNNDCVFFPASKPSGCGQFHYFSHFQKKQCLLSSHRCTQHPNSTSQLWFGQGP